MPAQTLMASCLVLLLAGCFASEQPLITGDNADNPFPDGTRLAEFSNCDATAAGELLGCKGYRQTGTDTLSVKDGIATVRAETGIGATVNKMLPGSTMSEVDVRFKQVAPGLYAIQTSLGDNPPGTGPEKGLFWTYMMMRRDGDSAYFYLLQCEKNGDHAYLRSGALIGIVDYMLQPTCEPASLDGLAKIMADRIANGQAPDKRFDILR